MAANILLNVKEIFLSFSYLSLKISSFFATLTQLQLQGRPIVLLIVTNAIHDTYIHTETTVNICFVNLLHHVQKKN